MSVLLTNLIKLLITVYLLFGGYTLFCGFLEKSRKKKIVGALVLIVPTVALIAAIVILSKIYGV